MQQTNHSGHSSFIYFQVNKTDNCSTLYKGLSQKASKAKHIHVNTFFLVRLYPWPSKAFFAFCSPDFLAVLGLLVIYQTCSPVIYCYCSILENKSAKALKFSCMCINTCYASVNNSFPSIFLATSRYLQTTVFLLYAWSTTVLPTIIVPQTCTCIKPWHRI